MTNSDMNMDPYFLQLVLSLQMAAMQQMGKVASPMTGKVERNLEQAKISIEMLNMISEKTKSNLVKEEEELLSKILYEIRLNYIDEQKKPDQATESDKKEETGNQETKTSDVESEGSEKKSDTDKLEDKA